MPAPSHLDPASRRVGTVLDGKWTLERLLGVGGMAAVYEGTHRNGARAAIKLFPFSVTTSVEFAERILREGYLANKIGHPAVVRVLDDHLDREREYAYLVMELLEGETARQRVERTGPLSPLEAARKMIELADCLAVAHEKGVVHRDIKPENLFFTDENKLKVLDFGVARALDGTSSSVTRTGTMLGTPAYMSPEQARGRPSEVSTRSDLYSAGATLLFLVAGEFLHEGESAQEIMVRAAWTPARKMAERQLGLPLSIATVIDGACEFDQTDRYQTAAEMRRDLELALAELERDPTASEPVVRVSKVPVRGPISTAPLPLNGAALRNAAELTVADGAHPPTSTTIADTGRRMAFFLGGALATVAAVLAIAVWPRAHVPPPNHVQANPPRAAALPPAAPVPAPPASVRAAASPADSDSEPVTMPERVHRRAKIVHSSHPPAATLPPAKPILASSVMRPPATLSPPKIVPIGRDVGY